MQLALALLALAAQTPRGLGEVVTLQLAKGWSAQDVWVADVDLDGEQDVIVSASDAKKKATQRSLNVFRARASAPRLASTPDPVIELTPDVVAWAAGDVDPARGEELVLFSARGAFACRLAEKPEQRFARLAELDFLWQLPDRQECWAYPAALVDLDGDKRLDLVLPEPDGYAIALRARPPAQGFGAVSRPRLPADAFADESLFDSRAQAEKGARGSRRIELRFGDESDVRLPRALLSVNERAPAPQVLDFDGDGRLDLLAQGTKQLYVWIQKADGSFDAAPRFSFPLPVPVDRERELDTSYSAHALDTGPDGRADVAIFAGDKRSSDVRTQLLLFVQGAGRGDALQSAEAPLFGPKNLPEQLLVLGGFVAGASFADLDGDKRPDLFVRTVRPDLIDQLRSASTETIDADVYVYRNENGLFAKRPDLSWRVNIPIKDFDLTLSFIGDVNGDGLADLLVRDRPERLRVLPLARTRDGLALGETPLFEISLDPKAQIRIGRRADRRAAAVREVPVIWLALLLAQSPAPTHLARVQTLEPPFALAAHRWVDVDGDKRTELVVFGRAGEVRTYAQAAGAAGFAAQPLGSLQLADPRHTLLDTAQLQGETGALQLVAASPAGVQAFALDAQGAFAAPGEMLIAHARFKLRVGMPTLADLAQDVNNDGRPDLVLPGPQSCELWLNDGLGPATGGVPARWPSWRKAATVAVDLKSSNARANEELSDVLSSSFTIPALSTRDVNGDKRPDLLVVDGDKRGFHLQREDGSFPEQPDVALDLSIFRDSTEQADVRPGHTLVVDSAATFQSRDLDGDAIPDYVIAHRRKVWVFHGSKAGPQFQSPATILKAADDITALQLARLDADPYPDLLLVKVQVPTIATLVRGVFGEWDVDVSAAGYLNRAGKDFETSPSLKSDIVLRLPSILSLLKEPAKFLQRFEDVRSRFRESATGDFDGSGTKDVALISSDSSALEVWLVHDKAGTGPNKVDGEELLRKLLFEDPNKVWDIDRVVVWLGSMAERRTALLTGGRAPDARIELRDKATARLSALECADVDGDGREELLLRYEIGSPPHSVFDILRWK